MVLEVFIGACIVYYFGVLQHMASGEGRPDPDVVGDRHPRLVLGGVVRHPHEHLRQQPHRVRLAARASRCRSTRFRSQAGMSIGVLLICVELIMMLIILLFVPAGSGRRLLPRLRHRRVAGRLGAAHRGRHLHQDRRHRLRPDEDRLQDQGRRPAQPRRDRRLHRRQRRRLGRPDGGRLRDLRRHRRGADLASSRWRSIPEHKAQLLVWIFVMRVLMIVTSIVVVLASTARSPARRTQDKDKIDFEAPLTSLVWITSLLSIVGDLQGLVLACWPASAPGCGGSSRPSSRAARWRRC